jgi:hypothetical protein
MKFVYINTLPAFDFKQNRVIWRPSEKIAHTLWKLNHVEKNLPIRRGHFNACLRGNSKRLRFDFLQLKVNKRKHVNPPPTFHSICVLIQVRPGWE